MAAISPAISTAQAATVACLLCKQERNAADFLLARNGFTFSAFCAHCRVNRADEVKRVQRTFARGEEYVDPQRVAEFRQSALEARILPVLQAFARRRINKRKGVRGLAEECAVKLARLPERVAAIVGKTYAVQGDSCELADDEALGRIRDLLLELDEEIIDRNKNKRLSKRA